MLRAEERWVGREVVWTGWCLRYHVALLPQAGVEADAG